MPKGYQGFQKGIITNPKGRGGSTGNKNKQKIRDAISNILDDNIDKVITELGMLTGKDFLDFYTRFLEYGLPKLQRQIIEIDPDTIVRGWQILPASAVIMNGKDKKVEQIEE